MTRQPLRLAVLEAERILTDAGVASPRVDAELLAAHVVGVPRGRLPMVPLVDPPVVEALRTLVSRRAERVPLQHLTGRQPFRGLDLAVRPGVFVPRPETEVLVQTALEKVSALERPIVVDVGTGTGAIALSIKQERPDAVVFATDLSSEAVALARSNADRAGLDVTVIEGDLLSSLPSDLSRRIDVVVSNPPYVSTAEFAALPAEVLADPELSLDGGAGGVQVIERLARESPAWLRRGGFLVVEIGSEQGMEVSALLSDRFEDVRVLPDLAGRDRVVAGRVR